MSLTPDRLAELRRAAQRNWTLLSGTFLELLDMLDEKDAEIANANAIADSMDHFAEVANRVERRNNELVAENVALRAKVASVEAAVSDFGHLDCQSTSLNDAIRNGGFYLDCDCYLAQLRAALATSPGGTE